MPGFYDAETGQPIPDDGVSDAIASGRASIDADASVVLRDRTGKRIQLTGQEAADGLAQQLALGYRIESDAERLATEQEFAARDAPIQAGAEALASGATLGLSDFVGGQLSPEYAQGAAARRESLGGVGTALEIGGAILPTLVSGGTLTPAGAVARLSESAGAALERTLIGRGVGAGVAKVAGMGAEGMLDGAISGVGQQLSEDSLGGTDITAERLLASGGLGALLGLGAGGAVGLGAGAIARRGARGAADRIAARESLAPLMGAVDDIGAKDAGLFRYLPDDVLDKGAKYASAATGTDEKVLREAIGDSKLRGDWLNQDEIKLRHTQDLRKAVNSVEEFDPLFRSIGAGEYKAETVLRDIPKGREYAEAAVAKAAPILDDIKRKVDTLAPDLSPKQLNVLRRDYNAVEVALQKAAADGDNAAIYNTLESYKRNFDDKVLAGPKGGNSHLGKQNYKAIFDMSRDGGDRVRKLLEDESVFGELGRKQRERNAAWRKYIDSGTGFNNSLMQVTGESADNTHWWMDKRVADGDKTNSFIENLNNPLRDDRVALVQKHIDAGEELLETLKRNGEIPAGAEAQFEKAIAGAKRSKEVLLKAADDLQKFGNLNALDKASREANPLISPQMGAIAGGFAFGPVGAAVGAGIGGLANLVAKPGGVLKRAAQLEAIHRRAVGTSAAVRAKTTAAVKRLALPRPKRLAKAGVRASVLLFGSDRDTRRKNAEKLQTRLTELQKDPLRMVDAMGYQTRGMADVAPRAAAAITQRTTAAAQFLASKLPPPPSNPNLLQPGLNKTKWTDEQVDKISRYAATIKDPLSAVDDLKEGKLSPETVEALQAVYPKLYDEMRQAAIEEVALHGDEMPYDSVLQLSLLLGFQGHPTLNPQFMQRIQSAHASAAEATQAQAPSPSNTKPMQFATSEVDRLMGGT